VSCAKPGSVLVGDARRCGSLPWTGDRHPGCPRPVESCPVPAARCRPDPAAGQHVSGRVSGPWHLLGARDCRVPAVPAGGTVAPGRVGGHLRAGIADVRDPGMGAVRTAAVSRRDRPCRGDRALQPGQRSPGDGMLGGRRCDRDVEQRDATFCRAGEAGRRWHVSGVAGTSRAVSARATRTDTEPAIAISGGGDPHPRGRTHRPCPGIARPGGAPHGVDRVAGEGGSASGH
jgi:hypothetical protein